MKAGFDPFRVGSALRRARPRAKLDFPLEFYLSFWDILAQDLRTVLKDFERRDLLPESFRAGIVTLIGKKDDKTDLKKRRAKTL